MTDSNFNNELSYAALTGIAKQLLAMELITSDEYKKLNKRFIETFHPVVSSLREFV